VKELTSLCLERIRALPAEEKKRVKGMHAQSQKKQKWMPNEGPQAEGYFSEADVLLFGGEPGGGKSQLGLGLAFNCHKRSLILRRQYTDLGGLIDDAIKINGSRDGFNGQPPPRLTLSDGHFIDFGACARVGDEQHWMGKAHDLIVPDEGTQFAYVQIRFLMGWLRHEDPNQRTRVIIPTNPPLNPEGLWVVQMFAPWLDDRYPYPAKPGELRWVVSDENGNDRWVDGPAVVEISGKMVRPLSRTFIPSSVEDNPYYAAGGYRAQLDALIEPHRSILLGRFKTAFRDQPNQIIPTVWVREAQERWKPKPPGGIPMCAVGADCSGGGTDPLVIGWRHDGWFSEFEEVKGQDLPMHRIGAFTAGSIISHRRDDAQIVIDMGGGYGGAAYEWLHANNIEVEAYKGAEKTSRRTADKKLGFRNKRTAALWGLREALDPGQPGGSPISLPPDHLLLADLTAPTFTVGPQGYEAEDKKDVCERLGRSTDRGDVAIMLWWTGPRMKTAALEWATANTEQGISLRGAKRYQKPVVMSQRQMARRR
jgi:hypothetical protein